MALKELEWQYSTAGELQDLANKLVEKCGRDQLIVLTAIYGAMGSILADEVHFGPIPVFNNKTQQSCTQIVAFIPTDICTG